MGKTKLAWGPECGPERRWIDEQLRLRASEEVRKLEVRKLAKLDPREPFSNRTGAQSNDNANGNTNGNMNGTDFWQELEVDRWLERD